MNPTQPDKNKDKKREVYLKNTYKIFILWDSIPALLKVTPKTKRRIFELSDQMNELCDIRFDKDFAKKFNINRDTIYEWRKREDYQKQINKIIDKNWVMKFKKEIDFHFTQKVIKEADAARVKLWKQLFEGWNEKIESDIDLSIDKTFKEQYEKDPDGTIRQIISAGKRFLVGKLSQDTSKRKNSKK